MYWTELKRALLYGQPTVGPDNVQAHVLKTAMRDIIRLIGCGWIDNLTDDALQRIQRVCQTSQCPEIWEEFQLENPLLKRRKKARKSAQKRSSDQLSHAHPSA